MGKPQREKGKRGERAWVTVLTEMGIDAQRTGWRQVADKQPDVAHGSFVAEVKTHKQWWSKKVTNAFSQAADVASKGQIPYLAAKNDRGPWYVLLRADDFGELATVYESVKLLEELTTLAGLERAVGSGLFAVKEVSDTLRINGPGVRGQVIKFGSDDEILLDFVDDTTGLRKQAWAKIGFDKARKRVEDALETLQEEAERRWGKKMRGAVTYEGIPVIFEFEVAPDGDTFIVTARDAETRSVLVVREVSAVDSNVHEAMDNILDELVAEGKIQLSQSADFERT